MWQWWNENGRVEELNDRNRWMLEKSNSVYFRRAITTLVSRRGGRLWDFDFDLAIALIQRFEQAILLLSSPNGFAWNKT